MSVVGLLGTEQSVKTKITVIKVRGSKCYNIALVYGKNEDFVIVSVGGIGAPELFNKEGVDQYLENFNMYEDSVPVCTCEISFNRQIMSREEAFNRILNAEKPWGFKPKAYPEFPYHKEDGFEGYVLDEDTGMGNTIILTNAPRELLETQIMHNFKRHGIGEDVSAGYDIIKAMGYSVVVLGERDELIKTYGRRAIHNVLCDDAYLSVNWLILEFQNLYSELYEYYDEEEEENE